MSEKKAAARKADEPIPFEKALERIEKIVGEMEEGSLSLDRMISHFEEGQELIKFCSAKLNEVERRIEILAKKGGQTVVEPFEEEEETVEDGDDSTEDADGGKPAGGGARGAKGELF